MWPMLTELQRTKKPPLMRAWWAGSREAEALRSQMHELTAALVSLKRAPVAFSAFGTPKGDIS